MITKGAFDIKVLQLKSYSCCGKKKCIYEIKVSNM